MKTTGNTILITGGSAGIGLEMAKVFVQQGNNVIITGRDAARLESAKAQLGNVTAIKADVTSADDVEVLTARIQSEFPELNILINNAGRALLHDLAEGKTYDIAVDEMTTNYFSILRLTDKLLPLLKGQKESAIVNVSSVVAYVPSGNLPTYAASKAALHSYSVSLRLALKDTSINVFELMPPLVNTELSKDIGGAENGIAPSIVAEDVLDALATDRFEIRTGQTEDVYRLSLANPAEALNVMNPVT